MAGMMRAMEHAVATIRQSRPADSAAVHAVATGRLPPVEGFPAFRPSHVATVEVAVSKSVATHPMLAVMEMPGWQSMLGWQARVPAKEEAPARPARVESPKTEPTPPPPVEVKPAPKPAPPPPVEVKPVPKAEPPPPIEIKPLPVAAPAPLFAGLDVKPITQVQPLQPSPVPDMPAAPPPRVEPGAGSYSWRPASRRSASAEPVELDTPAPVVAPRAPEPVPAPIPPPPPPSPPPRAEPPPPVAGWNPYKGIPPRQDVLETAPVKAPEVKAPEVTADPDWSSHTPSRRLNRALVQDVLGGLPAQAPVVSRAPPPAPAPKAAVVAPSDYPGDQPSARPSFVPEVMRAMISKLEAKHRHNLVRLNGSMDMEEAVSTGLGMGPEEMRAMIRWAWQEGLVRF